MAYTLAGTTVRRPSDMTEENSTQYAQNRTLGGTVGRDYFGSNKRKWTINYRNLNVTDYATLNTIYQNYLSTKTPVTLIITEGSYAPTNASVHVDFLSRAFTIPGSSYISDCTLVLTEA